MTEHTPQSRGVVQEHGTFDADSTGNQRLRSVIKMVEDHGEAHASFRGIEDEVELRLGTTAVDYDTNTFLVWDGDTYQRFNAAALNHAYKPMEVFH